jgi:hypothetical protein
MNSRILNKAGVLELVDKQDLKSCGGNTVWVRPPPSAQRKIRPWRINVVVTFKFINLLRDTDNNNEKISIS